MLARLPLSPLRAVGEPVQRHRVVPPDAVAVVGSSSGRRAGAASGSPGDSVTRHVLAGERRPAARHALVDEQVDDAEDRGAAAAGRRRARSCPGRRGRSATYSPEKTSSAARSGWRTPSLTTTSVAASGRDRRAERGRRRRRPRARSRGSGSRPFSASSRSARAMIASPARRARPAASHPGEHRRGQRPVAVLVGGGHLVGAGRREPLRAADRGRGRAPTCSSCTSRQSQTTSGIT